MKLLQGGNGARRGSERMVREKIDVALEASTSLTAGAWGEKNCPSISKTGRGECVEVDLPSSRPCRSCRLLDDVKFDLCDTAYNHSQRFGRGVGNVDNSSADIRTAIIDPDRHGLPAGDVRYPQPGAEWQRGMGGRQFVRIEFLAGRGLGSFRVEAGNPIRCDLCRGCFFVRCERRVLSCDRHAPLWRERYGSMVLLGRLAAWRDHFGFIGGNMGLCAGRQRGSSQNNGKTLHDAPYARARAQSRAYANCFDVNVRSSGKATGKHIVPRLPNPTCTSRNPIGAEPSQTSAIAASFTRFHVSVVIEPHLAADKQAIGAVPASHGQWSRPEFVAISWQYLRSYFRLAEPHIAARQNRTGGRQERIGSPI